MNKMKIHIYQIYFLTSNKCYIGQTRYLETRMLKHIKNKSLVGKALRKYDDWQVSVLHTCKSHDEANRIEIEEIRNQNSIAPNGYNLTHGGEGGDTFTDNPNKEAIRDKHKNLSEETLEKLRHALQGNQRAKGKNLGNQFAKTINIGNQYAKWYKHTEETIEKLKETRKGRKPNEGNHHTKEAKKKMGHFGKDNPMKNPVNVIKCNISRLRNKIAKAEQDL